MTQGEENLKRLTDDEGRVVAVMEKRAVDARREGYFIIQVSLHSQCVGYSVASQTNYFQCGY